MTLLIAVRGSFIILSVRRALGDALPDHLLAREVDDVDVGGALPVADGLDLRRESRCAVHAAAIAVVAVPAVTVGPRRRAHVHVLLGVRVEVDEKISRPALDVLVAA
jgi:hypothetical protein